MQDEFSEGSMLLTFEVPLELAKKRLDVVLVQLLPSIVEAQGSTSAIEFTRSRVQKLIEAGLVELDGRVGRSASKVQGLDSLSVKIPPPEAIEASPENIPLQILYEDSHLIVVNKPAGLVVHPAPGHASGTLVNALLYHCDDLSGIGGAVRPGIVHRLDRWTSGAMVAAKTDQAHARLVEQFQARNVRKHYLAAVYGKPKSSSGTFSTFYGRHPKDRKKYTGKLDSGKEAVTHYDIRMSVSGVSFLDIVLETGRTHQIRVHFAESGYPLLGDSMYGKKVPEKALLKVWWAAVRALPGQALHARELAFDHPVLGNRMEFEADLPDSLVSLMKLAEGLLKKER